GAEKYFAKRDRGKGDRQRTGREHPAPHRLQQLRKMAVAVIETRRRIGDPDHWLRQQCPRVAHGLGDRTAQVEREVAVAVIGEAALQTVRVLCHLYTLARHARLASAGQRGGSNVSLLTCRAPLGQRGTLRFTAPLFCRPSISPAPRWYFHPLPCGLEPRALSPRQEPW